MFIENLKKRTIISIIITIVIFGCCIVFQKLYQDQNIEEIKKESNHVGHVEEAKRELQLQIQRVEELTGEKINVQKTPLVDFKDIDPDVYLQIIENMVYNQMNAIGGVRSILVCPKITFGYNDLKISQEKLLYIIENLCEMNLVLDIETKKWNHYNCSDENFKQYIIDEVINNILIKW